MMKDSLSPQTDSSAEVASQKHSLAQQEGYARDRLRDDSQEVPVLHPCDLSVVIPTRNERDNILPLLSQLKTALDSMYVEIIFVDDSDDETPRVIKEASHTLGSALFQVHLEHRVKGPARAGGLATAVDLGLRSARATYVAVLDADLQHPPEHLRIFYEQAVALSVDLVLASRYIKGGGYKGLDGISRLLISVGLKWTAKIAFPKQLLRVSDPLGGFFLLRRALLNDVTLRPIGYKILLEILIRCSWKSLVEVPYHFQARENGQSKASMKHGIQVLQHILRLWREVPAAGRLWKISAMLLLDIVIALTLVLLYPSMVTLWAKLSIPTFALVALGNFWLLNAMIFPPAQMANVVRELALVPTVQPATKPALDAAPTEKIASSSVPAGESMQVEKSSTKPLPAITVDLAPTVKISRVAQVEKPLPHGLPVTESEHKQNKILARVGMVMLVATAVWIGYTLPGAWIVLAAFLIGFSIITANNIDRHQLITRLLAVTVGISCVDYISWRFAVTNWGGWWIAVPLLGAETLGALHTLGFQYTLWPRPRPNFRWREDPSLPIFIFIPTVNEGVTILEPTLLAAQAARTAYRVVYPHAQVEIVVCNDGLIAHASNWQETEVLAQRLGVTCITRTVPGGAKAGNIEHARQQLHATDDALLVIFDADQVAKPDFLLKTIPAFGDPRMGWVQTGQYYRNLDNPTARWADDQQSMFYNLICPGKAALNAAFICGTNVVIRTSALDQIGGFPQDSVTEDFSASISLHPYWRSLYLTDVLATGLGPLDVSSYLKQQRRWAIGTLGVFRTHWREILLPKRNGLSFSQRVQYFLACTHYLCGLRDLIYLLAPILFIITGIPAVRGSTLQAFLWHFLPYWISSMAALWYASQGITGLRGIIIGFGSFPVLIESLIAVLLKRKSGFTVTSKQRKSSRSLNYLLIYGVFILAGIASIALVTRARPDQQASTFISAMWIVYSLLLLGSFLWLNVQDLRWQSAASKKHEATNDDWHTWDYPARLKNRQLGLQPVWNLLQALLLACVVFTTGNLQLDTSYATPFVVSQDNVDRFSTGLSLPEQFLKNKPAQLSQLLHTHFSIIGRTQDVQDQFDRTWADQLAANNERPWITLEFGVFQADGKPPLDANLTAITNGVHDTQLQRWAQSIRDYGKPVYLTVLLHVDRNWSLSSAVANGGIPQDAPRAWEHIQSVFKQAGATNVVWVWSPADPAHDQPYAPPASTIDVVLLSLISYPHTIWADPQKSLNAVVARYPGKPILLEVSADGPAQQKAAWLAKVGAAVNATPAVYALIYHEGAPGNNPTPAQNEQWSMVSDQSSFHAMRQIVLTIHKEHSALLSSTRQIAQRNTGVWK
jgi:cellulose synthase/poly-beta-1,6-N-acetylglucosamine synthase-like glycosyltransferase